MNQTRRTIGGLAFPALLLTLLLSVAQTASRPSTDNESDIASLPPDADNVELHHVKLVDGIMTEDHPIVMYKEDFVNEDYDPTKNQTKGNHHLKYKHLQRTRHHHSRPAVEKQQEKIRFDVLSETPIFVGDVDDDSDAYNFEAASLLEPSKVETLQKYPKKYHSRQRRQAYYPNARNSFMNDYYVPQTHFNYRTPSQPGHYYLPVETPRQFQRYPVAGKKPTYNGKLPHWQTTRTDTQPTGVRNRDTFSNDEDDNSLFHNSNPDDADYSLFDRPRPNNQISGGGGGSSSSNLQPAALEEPERRPIWGQSTGRRPNGGAENSLQTTRAPTFTNRRTTTTPRPRQELVTSAPDVGATTPKVSNCVWAIVNCCSQGSNRIRYSCFEEFGCHGAFWGVNPCADNVRDGAIASLTRSFSTGLPSVGQ